MGFVDKRIRKITYL
ncbi:unnamed protein product, partial [Allacma fusca]